jgi:hypothetical protein
LIGLARTSIVVLASGTRLPESGTGFSDFRDAEIAADFAGQLVIQLLMARDRGTGLVKRMDVDGMTSAFPEKHTAVVQ